MSRPVDLRSDTVTLPSAGMRRAMARARVGDARRGEDPSVRALEEEAAALFGKEAGLFVPSGTMGNLVAVAASTRPGDAVVAPAASHVAGREAPGVSLLAAVEVAVVDAPGGIFDAADVAEAAADAARRGPGRVRLACAENTHNAAGGTVFPLAALRRIRAACRKGGIRLHVDGSRIFNASAASGVSPAAWGKACDSLMFCLSKGLGAPVGSVVVGEKAFVAQARELSHRFGGGMRQAGIVAAGGLYALRHNVERLAQDHENARALADLLRDAPGIALVNDPPETNIVLLRLAGPSLSLPGFREALRRRGAAVDDRAFPLIRAVIHLGVERGDVERAAAALRQAAAGKA